MAPAAEVIEGEVVPRSLADGNPAANVVKVVLSTPASVREEMSAIYRLARRGKIRIEEATRLVYILDRIAQAMKAEAEMEALEAAYAEAFTGLRIMLAPKRKPKEEIAP